MLLPLRGVAFRLELGHCCEQVEQLAEREVVRHDPGPLRQPLAHGFLRVARRRFKGGGRGAQSCDLSLQRCLRHLGGDRRRHAFGHEVPVGLEVFGHDAAALVDSETVVLTQVHEPNGLGVVEESLEEVGEPFMKCRRALDFIEHTELWW